MQKSKELFDLSNYKYNHFLYDETNKKVVGKMKDETDGIPIVEFCGIRSKMYSTLLDNEKEKKTAKGIPKKIMEKKLSHQKYKDCIMNEEKQSVDVYNLKSSNHVVKTVKLNKTSLCCYDDKFYYIDGLNSLPYGHFLIPKK
jgi:hypothetical protein